MEKITYKWNKTMVRWYVYLGKKKVGAILRTADGYKYRPNGSRNEGETFPTIEECKKSLVEE